MNKVPFRKERSEVERKEMGISLSNWKFVWSPKKYGILRGWPYSFKKFIVSIWNHVACTIIGHSYLCRRAPGELPVCCDCIRRVKPTIEQESSVINEW